MWDDARHLPEANSITPVDGNQHLLRLYRLVMDAEQETLPDDALAHPKPVRAVVVEGVETSPPSWRYRVSKDVLTFSSMLVRGDSIPAITEVEVVAAIARLADGQRDQLKSDKDDAIADWKIAAYEITMGIKKRRRGKVLDPNFADKVGAWRGRLASSVEDGEAMPAKPSKKMHVLQETPGFELRIVWVDLARQDEPQRGALGSFLKTGYFPVEFQKQRDEAFRIIKTRLAVAGQGAVSDLPAGVVDDVLAMARGGMAAERIASFLSLTTDAVKRIVVQQSAAPGKLSKHDKDVLAAHPGTVKVSEVGHYPIPAKAPRKPRTKKEPAAEPPAV